MNKLVLVSDDSAVCIIRINRPERKNTVQAFSLLARARPLSAEAVEPAGLGNDAGRCRSTLEDARPAARESTKRPAVALARTCLRGDSNDVATRSGVETMQSDETGAAIAAFLSGKTPKM